MFETTGFVDKKIGVVYTCQGETSLNNIYIYIYKTKKQLRYLLNYSLNLPESS